MGAWDEDRRSELAGVFEQSGLSYASDVWQRVEPLLQSYADEWAASYDATCADTRVHGRQPVADMELRLACLREARAELVALVDLVAEGDPEVLRQAVELSVRLRPLDQCEEVSRLRDRKLLPADPELAQQVELARGRLARATTLDRAGRWRQAGQTANEVLETAQALEFVPLQAEAMHELGHSELRLAEYESANLKLQRAYTLALRHDMDGLAAAATTQLVRASTERGEYGEAVLWGVTAGALVERWGDPLGQIAFASEMAVLERQRGNLDAAGEHLDRALEIGEEKLGPDAPELATTLNAYGALMWQRGEFDAAREYFTRSIEVIERVYGTSHPHLNSSLVNLGIIEAEQGNYTAAQDLMERSLARQREVYGDQSLEVALALNNLGSLWLQRRDAAKARPLLERSLRIREQKLDPDHPSIAGSLTNLAELAHLEGDIGRAQADYERAIEIRERKLGTEDVRIAPILEALGDIAEERGDTDEAVAAYRRSVELKRKAMGDKNLRVSYPLLDLGQVLLQDGRPREALPYFEEVLEIRLATEAGPLLRSEAHYWLGKARWALGDGALARTSVETALELARQAEEDLIGAGEQAERWLSEHGTP